MNLSIITKNIISNLKEEIEKEDNIKSIKDDLLKPLIKHIMDELYPYFLKTIIIIIVIFNCENISFWYVNYSKIM